MEIEFLAILVIALFGEQTHSTYVWRTEPVSLKDANTKCEELGMRLLVIETKSDADRLRVFLNGERPELWLGLNWNRAVGNYEWSTGEQLPVVNWCDVPDYRSSNQACVMWENKCTKSIICSSTRKFYCFNTDNAQGYTEASDPVDYFTAKKTCEDNGGHLPMLRTIEEQEDFIKFVKSHSVNKVWIGGEEVADDYIKWISGEEFPVHIWFNSQVWDSLDKHPEVHVHVDSKSFKFHPDLGRSLEFVCETVEKPGNTGYFVHLADNMTTLALPLAELPVTKKIQCAVECSKALRCKKYTLKLSVCTLYKDVLFYSNDSGTGASLWIKVVKGSN